MTEIVRGHFDGIRIRFYDAEGRLVSSTLAVSGEPLAQSPKFQQERNKGPIPEGEWVISSRLGSTWNPFDDDKIQAIGPEIKFRRSGPKPMQVGAISGLHCAR
jgi:hypothetical protein